MPSYFNEQTGETYRVQPGSPLDDFLVDSPDWQLQDAEEAAEDRAVEAQADPELATTLRASGGPIETWTRARLDELAIAEGLNPADFTSKTKMLEALTPEPTEG